MVPPYEDLMLPLLAELEDGNIKTVQAAFQSVADNQGLSSSDLEELLPSGKETVFRNRISWAGTYLAKAGLLERPVRGSLKITEKGKATLQERPSRIDNAFLSRFPEFISFRQGTAHEAITATPQEGVEKGFQDIASKVKDEIIERLLDVSPQYFERIVIDVLVGMGYGGSHEDAAKAVGRSGDEGIDGMISEDRLGLDSIYVQAKRWKGSVGRPDVQGFVGALSGKHAMKGIFITTSSFSKDATEYVKSLREKVVLIDGQRLAALMYEFNIGVSTENILYIKKLDTDYFLAG